MSTPKLFADYPESVLRRFKKFHQENPHIYAEFRRLAFEMIATGRTKYSAEAIINVMRWNHDVKTTGDVFELNNDFSPLLARLFIYHHPKFDGFFEFRAVTSRGLKSVEQRAREADLEETAC